MPAILSQKRSKAAKHYKTFIAQLLTKFEN
jgi:hypothetical protein